MKSLKYIMFLVVVTGYSQVDYKLFSYPPTPDYFYYGDNIRAYEHDDERYLEPCETLYDSLARYESKRSIIIINIERKTIININKENEVKKDETSIIVDPATFNWND